MTDDQFPRPSGKARNLVAGSFDLHVHVAPDVMRRNITDIELANRHYQEGLGGFVLKSHYVPTAERASTVSQAVPGVGVFGAITLNGSVGGMNPLAVEIAALEGARFVWMPTVDSSNQRSSTAQDPVGAKPPMWAQLQKDLTDRGMASPPVEVLDPDGNVLDEVKNVLSVIARHDLVLATGHLSRNEILAVVREATNFGIKRIVVTHPEFTSQRLGPKDQAELAELGAYLERCFTTPFTGKVAWSEMISNIRHVGVEHSFLSSDLGQPFNPPVEDGLALMADHLMEAGFNDEEIVIMTVGNTAKILGTEKK